MSIPGSNDYGQNYNGNGQNGYNPPNGYNALPTPPVAPQKKSSKGLLIAGASVLTVALLGGGAFAATNVFNNMSDKDISVSMPGNTSIFGEIDLNPSNEQKLGVLSLATKANKIAKDDTVKETKNPKELVSDAFFKDLNFEEDVEPWIGDKAAMGVWGDLPSSGLAEEISQNDLSDYTDEYATDDYENDSMDEYNVEDFEKDNSAVIGATAPKSSNSNEINAVFVYEIKDKEKAEAAIKKTSEKYYVVTKDYLTIANSESSLANYNTELGKATLKDNKDFQSDRKALNTDSVAIGWADIGKLKLQDMPEFESLSEQDITLDGRVISALSLSQGKVSSVTKMVGFNSDNYKPVDVKDGLNEIGKLPSSTVAALSIGGLDSVMKEAWNQNKDEIESSDSYADIMYSLDEYGIKLPEDFTKILGSEMAVGVSVENKDGAEAQEQDFALNARIVDADETLYKKIAADAGSEDLNITKDGSTVLLDYQGKDQNGKLSDKEDFKKAVGSLKDSQFVGYADLTKVAELSGSTDEESFGVIGLNGSYDKDKNVSTLTVNWIY